MDTISVILVIISAIIGIIIGFLSGKKIGKLKKRDEVTLYEQSKFVDEIDGEKNPWYKVKVSENEYGWLYGGYVRIFFEDENLGYYSKKERILESLE